MKFRAFASLFLAAALAVTPVVGVAAPVEKEAPRPQAVKVLVLSMFEVGKNSGDFAGEFQHWYEAYLTKARSYRVAGSSAPLYVNAQGVAGMIMGMGKANAAASLTALLSDRRFDWSRTYILVSGCGGMAPSRGTLGDVVWADQVVDYELGHGWQQSEIAPGHEKDGLFLKDDSYAPDGFIKLNSALAKWAYETSRHVKLADDPKARAYRALYGPDQKDKKPMVHLGGASVTGDSYWHGPDSSKRADEVTSDYGAHVYMVTQMEDNAFAIVARRFGLLNRLMVCRDIVNFDQPHTGQTVPQSLKASSGGFSIGMTNGFAVGRLVVDKLVQGWKTYADQTPQAR